MKKEDVAKLPAGLYRLWWKESRGGGNSLAAVGVTKNGGRWMAPLNWIEPTTDAIHWRAVEEAEMLVVTPNGKVTGDPHHEQEQGR